MQRTKSKQLFTLKLFPASPATHPIVTFPFSAKAQCFPFVVRFFDLTEQKIV